MRDDDVSLGDVVVTDSDYWEIVGHADDEDCFLCCRVWARWDGTMGYWDRESKKTYQINKHSAIEVLDYMQKRQRAAELTGNAKEFRKRFGYYSQGESDV